MIEFKYKGYVGKLVGLEDGLLFGEVFGLNKAEITFASDSPLRLEEEFQKSVDEYLSFCKEQGVAPEKTCSGKFQVRLTPMLHGRAIVTAKSRNMSLNDFVKRSIEFGVRKPDELEKV